jgi:ornithine cyclodeaminase/alanine dehydrogenase-like protein (mu-crystallin family)
MNTLILTRSEVMRLVNPATLIEPMRMAFCDYSGWKMIPGRRFFTPLNGPGDAMILAPGLTPNVPAYTVKVHAKFPDQQPAINGVLLLHDLQTGALIAVMDSTYLTAVRTGLGAALATNLLANPDAGSVAIIGAGVQGEFQLRYLSILRPLIRVTVYDIDTARADAYAARLSDELNIPITPSATLAGAVANAEIILTATWSKKPILFADMVRADCHITTVGADQPDEAEIAADLVKKADFFCDDRNLALSQGAIGGVGLSAADISAELGEVLAGKRSGRSEKSQITVYGAVGLAFQDLVVAWHIYQNARAQGVGRTLDFLA